MKRNLVIEIICSLLILLFVYTAGSKLLDLRTTYREMNYQPFPNGMTPFLVWGISILELGIAALLFFNKTKRKGLWASLMLMSAFTLYISAILLRFFDRIPCACGGVIKQLGWINHLYFNLFFVAIAIIGLKLMDIQRKKEQYEESNRVVFT